MYLQKKRQQLKVLSGHAGNVTKMYSCSVCGCIIQIVGRPLPPDQEKKLKSLPASKLEWPERLVIIMMVYGKQASQQQQQQQQQQQKGLSFATVCYRIVYDLPRQH